MPGTKGPKTVKGAQSDPNYVSRLLLDCVGLPVFHKIITPAFTFTLPFRTKLVQRWTRARSECLPVCRGPKNYSYATVYILALEMAGSGNQHCANCIAAHFRSLCRAELSRSAGVAYRGGRCRPAGRGARRGACETRPSRSCRCPCRCTSGADASCTSCPSIPPHAHNIFGQLSLASLRSRSIEYQLRLG